MNFLSPYVIIDGAMNLTGALIRRGGWFVHTLQTGRLAFYLAVTSFGIIFLWYLGNLPL